MVCFVEADSDLLQQGSWLNRLAAKYSSGNRDNPMVHVEIFFPEREDADAIHGKSCGIHYGGRVFMEPKRFSRKKVCAICG